jgi:hypothetical protein
MGLEAKCVARSAEHESAGKLHLETERLLFRGAMRLSVPLRAIKRCKAEDGCLIISTAKKRYFFDLGPAAEKWAAKILNPPKRADKLGIKRGLRVAILGIKDKSFLAEVRERTPDISRRARAELDLIYYAANELRDLARLAILKTALKPTGALWVVYPKGAAQIKEADVLKIGRIFGLVDTKVASFSATHTALKFMIPKASRPSAP